MIFALRCSTLTRALEKATQTVEDNSSRPVLSNYLFDVTKEAVTIAGTDLEVTAIVELKVGKQVKVGEPGRVTLPSDKIDAIARNTPGDEAVRFSFDVESNEVHIKAGKSKWVLRSLSADDYPRLPEFDEAEAQTVDRENFLRALELCSPFIAQDDTRPRLTMLVCQGGYAIGTNGHQFAAYRLTEDLDGLTIPRDACRALGSVLGGRDEKTFGLQRQDSHLLFRVGGDTFATRLLDAEPENLSRIIEGTDKSLEYSFTVDLAELRRAVGSVYVVQNDAAGIILQSVDKTTRVADARTPQVVKLVTSDERGNAASAVVECDRDGPMFTCISVNAEYLRAMLHMVMGPAVTIQYGLPGSDGRRPPLRFEQDGFVAVLMQLLVPIPNGAESE